MFRKSNPTEVVRRCRVCGCRSDYVRFMVMKDSKSGKMYMHNLCHPCRVEKNAESRARRLKKDPTYDVRMAIAWNRANRDRYNETRRLWNKKRKGYNYHWMRERT